MNNFSQKKIIRNFTKNTGLPYQETNDVSLKANQIIYTSVNNIFRKMVDNDLYNEKFLANREENRIGPIISTETDIRNATDGTKVWDPSIKEDGTELSIHMKHVRTIDETLSSVTDVIGSVNFICDTEFGIFVGTDQHLYAKQNNTWQVLSIDAENGEQQNGKSAVVNGSDVYFATNKNIRMVVQNQVNDGILSTEILSKTNSGNTKKINVMDGVVLFCDDQGVFQITDGKAATAFQSNDVRDMVFANSNHYVQTENDIYYGYQRYSMVTSDVDLNGTVLGMIEYQKNTYCFTSENKIYKLESSAATQMYDFGDTNIEDWVIFKSIVYVATSHGIYATSSMGAFENKITEEHVYSIRTYGGYLIYSDHNHVFYSQDGQIGNDVEGSSSTDAIRTNASHAVAVSGKKITNLVCKTHQDEEYEKVDGIEGTVKFITPNFIGSSDGLYSSGGDKLLDGDVKQITEGDGDVFVACGGRLYYYDQSTLSVFQNLNDVSYVQDEFQNDVVIIQGGNVYVCEKDTLIQNMQQISFSDMLALNLSPQEITATSVTQSRIYCAVGGKIKVVSKNSIGTLSSLHGMHDLSGQEPLKDIKFSSVNDNTGFYSTYSRIGNGTDLIKLSLDVGTNEYLIGGMVSIPVISSSHSDFVGMIDFSTTVQDSEIHKYGQCAINSKKYLFDCCDNGIRKYLTYNSDFELMGQESNFKDHGMILEGKGNIRLENCDLTLSVLDTDRMMDSDDIFMKYCFAGSDKNVYCLGLGSEDAHLLKSNATVLYTLPIDGHYFKDCFSETDSSGQRVFKKGYSSIANVLAFDGNYAYSIYDTEGNVSTSTSAMNKIGTAVAPTVDIYSSSVSETVTSSQKSYTFDIFSVSQKKVQKIAYKTLRNGDNANFNYTITDFYSSSGTIGGFCQTEGYDYLLESGALKYKKSNASSWTVAPNELKTGIKSFCILGTTCFVSKDGNLYKIQNIDSQISKSSVTKTQIATTSATNSRMFKQLHEDEQPSFAVFYETKGSSVLVVEESSSSLTVVSITVDEIESCRISEGRNTLCPHIEIFHGTQVDIYTRKSQQEWISHQLNCQTAFKLMQSFNSNENLLKYGDGLFYVYGGYLYYTSQAVVSKTVKDGLANNVNSVTNVMYQDSADGKKCASIIATDGGIKYSIVENLYGSTERFDTSCLKYDLDLFDGYKTKFAVKHNLLVYVLIELDDKYELKCINLGDEGSFETSEGDTKIREDAFYSVVKINKSSVGEISQITIFGDEICFICDGLICNVTEQDTLEPLSLPGVSDTKVDFMKNTNGISYISDNNGLSTITEDFLIQTVNDKIGRIKYIHWNDTLGVYLMAGYDRGLSSIDAAWTSLHDFSSVSSYSVYSADENLRIGRVDGLYKCVTSIKSYIACGDQITLPNSVASSYETAHGIYISYGDERTHKLLTRQNFTETDTEEVLYADKAVSMVYDEYEFVQEYGLLDTNLQIFIDNISQQPSILKCGYIQTGDFSHIENVTNVMGYDTVDFSDSNTKDGLSSMNCLTDVGEGYFLVGTDCGLNVLFMVGKNVIQTYPTDVTTCVENAFVTEYEIDRFTQNKKTCYNAVTENDVRKSENVLTGYAVSYGRHGADHILQKSEYECLMGGEGGLSSSHYEYFLSNDVYSQSVTELLSETDEKYQNLILDHINEYHQESSLITLINNKTMPVSFDEIDSEWNGRLVSEVRFSDSKTVVQMISGFSINEGRTSVSSDLSDISFIEKDYDDGCCELYVNIPTTNTPYVPHLHGLNGCNYGDISISRKNTTSEFQSDISKQNTQFVITINKKHFSKLGLVDFVVLNGNSLPCDIYKDDEYICNDGVCAYHSMVLPSIVNGICDNGADVQISARTFGQDSQSMIVYGHIQDISVNFFSYDGSYISGVCVSRFANAELCAPIPQSRTGYTFSRWVPSISSVVNDTDSIQVYNANRYTLSFNKNSASATGEMNPLKCTYDKQYTIPHVGFEYYDHFADSFFNAYGQEYNCGQVISNLTADDGSNIELSVRWKEISSFSYNIGIYSSMTQAQSNLVLITINNCTNCSVYVLSGEEFCEIKKDNGVFSVAVSGSQDINLSCSGYGFHDKEISAKVSMQDNSTSYKIATGSQAFYSIDAQTASEYANNLKPSGGWSVAYQHCDFWTGQWYNDWTIQWGIYQTSPRYDWSISSVMS